VVGANGLQDVGRYVDTAPHRVLDHDRRVCNILAPVESNVGLAYRRIHR
jgi:hypothetical protein